MCAAGHCLWDLPGGGTAASTRAAAAQRCVPGALAEHHPGLPCSRGLGEAALSSVAARDRDVMVEGSARPIRPSSKRAKTLPRSTCIPFAAGNHLLPATHYSHSAAVAGFLHAQNAL